MTTESPILVRVGDITLAYGRKPVLENVSLEIREGELWFLIGPNGAGKTTFLKAVTGVLKPVSGEVNLDGSRIPRDRIGFVPQRCDLTPGLPTTVREFVTLGLVGVGRLGANEVRERLARALARVGLEGREKADYWSLSGGQKRRALVARALIRRPALLIVDEPTTGLDIEATQRLLGCLLELNRKAGLTFLFVTHDLELARRHATHVALFRERGVLSGPAEDLLKPDTLEETWDIRLEGWARD